MLDCTVRVHAVARVQRSSCDRSRESLPEVDRSCAIKRSVDLKCTKPHAECAINSLQLRTSSQLSSSQLSTTSDIESTLFKSTLSNSGHRVNSLQLRTSSHSELTSSWQIGREDEMSCSTPKRRLTIRQAFRESAAASDCKL